MIFLLFTETKEQQFKLNIPVFSVEESNNNNYLQPFILDKFF